MIRLTPEETSLLENYSEDDYKYLFDENCFDSAHVNNEELKDDPSHKKLVLAAKIGKFLLEKVHLIDEQLNEARNVINLRDQEINFLKSKLSANEAFIQNYSRTSGYEDDDNFSTVSSTENTSYQSDSGVIGSISCATIDSLSRKIRELEDENSRIKQEFLHMSVEDRSSQLDEHDSSLVRDCLKQVKASNENSDKLREELNSRNSAHNELYTQYLHLKSAKTELLNKLEHLQSENELLKYQLKDAFTSKEQLAIHYKSLYDKYDEIITLYNDCRKELQITRKNLKKSIEANENYKISQSLYNLDLTGEENNTIENLLSSSDNTISKFDNGSPDPRRHSLASELQEAVQKKVAQNENRSTRTKKRPLTSSPKDFRQKAFLRPKSLVSNSRNQNWSGETEWHNQPSNFGIISSLAVVNDDKTPINELIPRGLKRTASVESINFGQCETQTMVSNDFSIYSNKSKLMLVKPMSGSNVLQRWQKLATNSSLINVMPSNSKGIIVRRQVPPQSIVQMLPNHDKSSLNNNKNSSDTIDQPIKLSKKHSLDNLVRSSEKESIFDQLNETYYPRLLRDRENPPSPEPPRANISAKISSGGLLSSARIHAFFNTFLPRCQSTHQVQPSYQFEHVNLFDDSDKSEHSSSSDSSKNGKTLTYISTTSKGLLEACDLVKKPAPKSTSRSEIQRLYDLSLQKAKKSDTYIRSNLNQLLKEETD